MTRLRVRLLFCSFLVPSFLFARGILRLCLLQLNLLPLVNNEHSRAIAPPAPIISYDHIVSAVQSGEISKNKRLVLLKQFLSNPGMLSDLLAENKTEGSKSAKWVFSKLVVNNGDIPHASSLLSLLKGVPGEIAAETRNRLELDTPPQFYQKANSNTNDPRF